MERLMLRTKVRKPSLVQVILYLTLLDLFLGGGGRLFDVGALSPRMYFYIISISISIYFLVATQRIKANIFEIIVLYTFTLLFSLFIAIINNNPLDKVFLDIKPLLFFYTIVFFEKVINNPHQVLRIVKLLRISSFILAASYLAILLFLYFDIIDFLKFYNYTSNTSEFFFRGNIAFMYKGFLYLGIGTFFFFRGNSLKDKLITLVLILACVLTFTRGFILALAAVYFIYIVLFSRYKLIGFSFFIIIAITGLLILKPIYDSGLLGDKAISNQVRFEQTSQVLEMVSPVSFFTGHGFGRGVEVSPVHMEIAYLEVFHKQGFIGLFFWGYLLYIIIFNFVKASKKGNFEIALPFLLSSIFIYVESFTNPFLLSPLGMVMVMLSIVCLNVIKNSNEHISMYRNL